MSKYIDVNLYVEMQIYDSEHEEWKRWKGTIEDLLDQWTEQGCPPTIDMVHCKDCKYSRVYALDSYEEPKRWCTVGIVKAVDDDDYCSWGE